MLLALHACLAVAFRARPIVGVALPTVYPYARFAGTRAAVPTVRRVGVSPRAQYDIDFSEVDYVDDDEEDDEVYAVKREARMDKARESMPTIANMTVPDLKLELRRLGLKMSGRKSELVERLTNVRRKISQGLPTSETEVQRDTEAKWYMLQTANGFEGTVERTLSQAIKVQGMGKDIDQIFLPILHGATSVRDSSVMPSYLLIHMRMNRELHEFVSGITYVVNFVGADHGGRSRAGGLDGTRGFVWPRPLSQGQYESIIQLTMAKQPGEEGEASQAGLAVGELVEVVSGPFKGMRGAVLEVGAEELCSVSLTVMGRQTSVQVPVRHCVPLDPELAVGADPSFPRGKRVDVDADSFERDRRDLGPGDEAETEDSEDSEDADDPSLGAGDDMDTDMEADMEAELSERMGLAPEDEWGDQEAEEAVTPGRAAVEEEDWEEEEVDLPDFNLEAV